METTLRPSDMKDPVIGKVDATKDTVLNRLNAARINPNENLGQHFLIDSDVIGILAQVVTPGNTVMEVGAGVGQLTEALAKKAANVIAIEIDARYKPLLDQVVKENPNLQIVYADAIALKMQDFFPKRKKDAKEQPPVQIISSLPYHITEPFMHKLIGLPVESTTLVVGQRFARAIQATDEESADFSKLTLLAQVFFDVDQIAEIDKQKFFPVPKTDSAIVRLTPRDEKELRSNKRDFVFRRLFLTAKRSPLVKNALKETFIEFAQLSQVGTLDKRDYHRRIRSSSRAELKQTVAEYNKFGNVGDNTQLDKTSTVQLTQNQARAIIAAMGIPEDILNKPFEQLDNNELKVLSKALR